MKFEYYLDDNLVHLSGKASRKFNLNQVVMDFPQKMVKEGYIDSKFVEEFLWAFTDIEEGKDYSLCKIKMIMPSKDPIWAKVYLNVERNKEGVRKKVVGQFEFSEENLQISEKKLSFMDLQLENVVFYNLNLEKDEIEHIQGGNN